ncbi:hypothetical protein M0804_015483 [Polistes exclamans]|nr:hypothetical protein M0804_015484 [Polistes exclamans]KAI4473117.1 hypothetical protein M0804_015483 [Polistes exclamans]
MVMVMVMVVVDCRCFYCCLCANKSKGQRFCLRTNEASQPASQSPIRRRWYNKPIAISFFLWVCEGLRSCNIEKLRSLRNHESEKPGRD